MSSDRYHVTTKLFELAHVNPPTHRLLTEAMPLMQKLSDDLDQSCHLTVYNQGRQIVVAKVDAPGGMGFSVRVGAELDVLVSASGRFLLAFQDRETRQMRIAEALQRRPDHADAQIAATLDTIRAPRLRVDRERSGARALRGKLSDHGLKGPGDCRHDGPLRGAHRPRRSHLDRDGRGNAGGCRANMLSTRMGGAGRR